MIISNFNWASDNSPHFLQSYSSTGAGWMNSSKHYLSGIVEYNHEDVDFGIGSKSLLKVSKLSN